MKKNVLIAILLAFFFGSAMAENVELTKQIRLPQSLEYKVSPQNGEVSRNFQVTNTLENNVIGRNKGLAVECLETVYSSWVNSDGSTGALVLRACGETYGEAGAMLDSEVAFLDTVCALIGICFY